jgi:chromosome segregation ATPase
VIMAVYKPKSNWQYVWMESAMKSHAYLIPVTLASAHVWTHRRKKKGKRNWNVVSLSGVRVIMVVYKPKSNQQYFRIESSMKSHAYLVPVTLAPERVQTHAIKKRQKKRPRKRNKRPSVYARRRQIALREKQKLKRHGRGWKSSSARSLRRKRECVTAEAAEAKEIEKQHAKKIKKVEKAREVQEKEDKKKVEESEKIVAFLQKENTKVRDQTKSMKTDMEREIEELEEMKAELVEKYDKQMEKAGSVPQDEFEANKKNVEESEKIVAFLKKENTKVDDLGDEFQTKMCVHFQRTCYFRMPPMSIRYKVRIYLLWKP